MDEIELLRRSRPSVSDHSTVVDQARQRFEHSMRQERDGGSSSSPPRRILLSAIFLLVLLVATSAVLVPTLVGQDEREALANSIVLPDGTELTEGELARYLFAGRHDELAELLGRHGIELVLDERPVVNAAVGRVFGWTIVPAIPGTDPEGSEAWVVTEDDAGSQVVVEIGRTARQGEVSGNEGLTLEEAYPEICDAVVMTDTRATHRALEELGFDVRWVVLSGDPDAPNYDPSSSKTGHRPPDSGTVLTVLWGPGNWHDPPPNLSRLVIEVIPEGKRLTPPREHYC